MPLKDRDVIQSYPLDLLEALERLAGSYGSDVVRDATRQLLAKPRGRSVLDDFALMRPRLIVEAQGWLAGNDLDARGRQQRIASEVAAGNPGHSFEATRERLRGKLRARWKGMVIMLAVPELLRNAPTSVLLHKMRQALRIEPSLAPLTNLIADLVADTLISHRALAGEPGPCMSLAHLTEAIEGAIGTGIGARVAAHQKVEAYRRMLEGSPVSEEIGDQ